MTTTASTTHAVIVNYNSGARDLLRAVRSLYTSQELITDITVVDNASRDGSLEACKKEFPRVHYIYNTHNVGFAAAVNSGIRYNLERGAQHILLLNPDAYIESDTVTILLAASREQKHRGILSPLIKSPQTKDIWFAAGAISWWRLHATHTIDHTAIDMQKTYSTQYVSGCVMLIDKDVFAQVGLFDERFFLYYEDADLCMRAQKDGFFVGVVPQAIAWHYEKSEAHKAQKTYWLVHSGLLFFSQHMPTILRWWFHAQFLLRRIKNIVLRPWRKNDAQHHAVTQAYHDYTHDTRCTHSTN